ncbi:MAG: M48 family metalloprotease [Elusimicrobia bacterium]|nr:M48 family metalloprotease [Elusimicrobiota bacterium]
MAALLLALAPASVAAAEPHVTRRANTELREGPGSYYPLLGVLPEGTPVRVRKAKDGWVNVGLGAKGASGWLSKHALAAKAGRTDLKALRLDAPVAPASPASVSAAVRGFALRYGRGGDRAVDGLLGAGGLALTAVELEEFRAQLARPRASDYEQLAALSPELWQPYETPLSEEGIGLGIAARVASEGLARDPRLVRYVQLVGTVLAEASPAYDRAFRFYVLQTPRLLAASAPGGHVFVSRGLIAACEDEAELAAVLAHELAHVARRHGLGELGKRTLALRAEAAQAELDRETGGGDAEEAELTEFASTAYDSVHKPRLLDYELEADRVAALVLARAGYDTGGLPRMIERVGRKAAGENADNPFTQVDFTRRAEAARTLLAALPKLRGATAAARFNAKKPGGP